MSINFVYFPFPLDILFLLNILIETIVVISLNVMLFWSGKVEKEMRKGNILIKLSIINLIFILLRFAVPGVVGFPTTEAEIITFRIYLLLTGLHVRLPFFITYGLLMYFYGRVNRDSISNKYRVSA